MLSKDNKELVQLQKGKLSDFPELPIEELPQMQIQSGSKGEAKPEDIPSLGSGFNHDTFGASKKAPKMGSGFHHDIFEKD